jgi:hypothetical protein
MIALQQLFVRVCSGGVVPHIARPVNRNVISETMD